MAEVTDKEEIIFRSESVSFIILFGIDINTPEIQLASLLAKAEVEIWSNTEKGYLKYAPCSPKPKATDVLYAPSTSAMKFLNLKNLSLMQWTPLPISKISIPTGRVGYKISGETLTDNSVVVYVILREVEVDIFIKALETAFPVHKTGPVTGELPPEERPLFHSEDVLVSLLEEKHMRLTLEWGSWTAREMVLLPDGSLSFFKTNSHRDNNNKKQATPERILLMKRVDISLLAAIDNTSMSKGGVNSGEKAYVIKGQLPPVGTTDTYFRVVLSSRQVHALCRALVHVGEKVTGVEKVLATAPLSLDHLLSGRVMSTRTHNTRSQLRRAIMRAADHHLHETAKQATLSKRGAFHWLPVWGPDLVQGSWCWVWGSVGVVITCAVVVSNKYYLYLSNDDSILVKDLFAATWILLLFSGIFTTLGSLAFARAFHEDPPVTPLFANWYHIQSDELLASWLFFLSVLPLVPYCCIYLYSEGYKSLIYIAALVFSLLIAIGALIFVKASYPIPEVEEDVEEGSEKKQAFRILYPIMSYLCCCCSIKTKEFYFVNDWLGGCWCFYWACWLAVIACMALLAEGIYTDSWLHIFVYSSSLIESVLFLWGSALMVAASFPEKEEDGDGNIDIETSGADAATGPAVAAAGPVGNNSGGGYHNNVNTSPSSVSPYDPNRSTAAAAAAAATAATNNSR